MERILWFNVWKSLPKGEDIGFEAFSGAQYLDHRIGIIHVFVPIVLEADHRHRPPGDSVGLPTNF